MATPVYLTKQNYFDFSGIDLQIELNSSNTDNPSEIVDIFLSRVENWCLDYLFMTFGVSTTQPLDQDDEPIFNVEAFKKGILHQIDYLRRNGDLSIQSINNGPKLAPNAYMVWKNAGMCNIAHVKQESFLIWG
jgi:hypothetical protein